MKGTKGTVLSFYIICGECETTNAITKPKRHKLVLVPKQCYICGELIDYKGTMEDWLANQED